MKHKKFKRLAAFLISLLLMAGVTPGMAGEVRAGTLTTERFVTKDDLLSNYNLASDYHIYDGLIAKIRFGANDREWMIAGKDANNGADTLALLSASMFTYSIYGSDSKYSTSTVKSLLDEYVADTTYFSSKEKSYIKDTTVSTEDWNGILYDVTGKLYLADAGRDDEGVYVCVGTNNNIPINLTNLVRKNGFLSGSERFWLRTPHDGQEIGALLANPGHVVVPTNVGSHFAVVPALDLNLSSVIFAAVAQAALSEGSLATDDSFTLRFTSDTFETAAINPAKTSVAVTDAPAGTYLVVQNDYGAFAKRVSGEVMVNAADIMINGSRLTSFENCKVWLEKTDNDRITTATLAVQATGYRVNITNPANSWITWKEDSGAEHQTEITDAMTDVVYTADKDYYFPENYKVESSNGINVKRNDATKLTVGGTPTANTEIMLEAATPKAEQPAPTGLTDGGGKIAGTLDTMEYASSMDAPVWTTCSDGETLVAPGTWYVRYKVTDTKKAGVPATVTVTPETHTITVSPEILDFGEKNEGYSSPEARTVTVLNTGNRAVTLTQPQSTSYEIGPLSGTTLAPGETQAFTIQPKAELPAGTYNETIMVSTDKETSIVVAVNFMVHKVFSVNISGSHMTRSFGSGEASQTVVEGSAITPVIYTADEGYYFPTDYNTDASMNSNGIIVKRDGTNKITVSGTPTADADIVLTASIRPMEATKPSAGTTESVKAAAKTGDETGMMIYGVLMLIAMAAMTVIFHKKYIKS